MNNVVWGVYDKGRDKVCEREVSVYMDHMKDMFVSYDKDASFPNYRGKVGKEDRVVVGKEDKVCDKGEVGRDHC